MSYTHFRWFWRENCNSRKISPLDSNFSAYNLLWGIAKFQYKLFFPLLVKILPFWHVFSHNTTKLRVGTAIFGVGTHTHRESWICYWNIIIIIIISKVLTSQSELIYQGTGLHSQHSEKIYENWILAAFSICH